jgi:hypothetical protein
MRFFSMRRTTASDGSGDSTAPPLQAASGSNVKPVPARALALVSDPTKAWDIVRAVQGVCGDGRTREVTHPTSGLLTLGLPCLALTGEPEILVDVEHRKAQDLYTDVAPPKREGTVRFVAVSDTHSTESRKSTGPTAFEAIPEGDVLLHCGDFTNIGRLEEIEAFAKWFGSLPHQRKIIIAGNHDLSLHEESYESTAARFGGEGRHRKLDAADVCSRARAILESIPNCEYLCDSGTSVEGIRVWGSPWQPEFCEWAFNLPRGEPCRAKWKLIPTGLLAWLYRLLHLLTHLQPASRTSSPPHAPPDRLTHLQTASRLAFLLLCGRHGGRPHSRSAPRPWRSVHASPPPRRMHRPARRAPKPCQAALPLLWAHPRGVGGHD